MTDNLPDDETNGNGNELLLNELRDIIIGARQRVARQVNSELVMTYWHIGKRINEEILKNERAEYGERICSTLSVKLVDEFGRGFQKRNIFRMVRFSEMITEMRIVSTLSTQLSWSHFVEIMNVKEDQAQKFYIELCRRERWSVRTLRNRINSMLYERTMLSKEPTELIEEELEGLQNKETPSDDIVFRNPYILDFLDLGDKFSEKDMESAILRELEHFIIEFGRDFTFVSRQKRMIIDSEDFYLDLLFYHREMKRLVAIELKTGKFKPGYKGQMELYLRWLDKYERKEDENEPIGLILCTESGPEQIRLLQLDKGEIRVSDYLTELPERKLLEKKIKEIATRQ